MSDPSYPGTPNVQGQEHGVPADPSSSAPFADSVETVDDVELLDPRPVVVDDGGSTTVDIDGEVVDVDEPEDQQDQDDEQGDGAQVGTDLTDDEREAGPNGTGVLVLETWQIQIPATGDATVDAALARLTDVEGLPPAQHADVYEAVHAGLHEALADLDRA